MDTNELVARLRGTIPAAITPMHADGTLDEAGLAANVDWLAAQGIAGLLMLGSTGEQPHLSEGERARLVAVARRHLPPDRVLLAGAGLPGTGLTIEEVKRAAGAGADAALVVTPSYYQKAMTEAALVAHYEAIAGASPIPILLYSVPGITGVTLPPGAVATLAAHPNVLGMKNSSSDLQLAVAYRAAAAAPFVILAGSAQAAPAALLLGLCEGVILAVANLLPEASVALVAAAQRNDGAEVRVAAALLAEASERVGRFGIAGWKAGVMARGGAGGPVRPPLRSLQGTEAAQVAEAVRALLGAGD